jgi:hypothetical protein
MSNNYIYSTASQTTDFAIYTPTGPQQNSRIERVITIKGGANVATRYPNLSTPLGVVTQVSDEDLAVLEKDYHFQQAVKHGFYTVDKRKADPEKVAKNMAPKDRSAPRTPDDPEFHQKNNGTTKGVKYVVVGKD